MGTVIECTCSVATGTLCDGHAAMRDGIPAETTYRTLCEISHTPTGRTDRVHLHCWESGARRLPLTAREFTVQAVDGESSDDCGMADCPARPSFLGW